MMNIVLDKGDVSRLQKELFVKYQVTSTAELKQQVMESGVHYDALIEHAQESVLVQKIQSLVLRNRFQVGSLKSIGCATSLLRKIHSSMLKIFTTILKKPMMLKKRCF